MAFQIVIGKSPEGMVGFTIEGTPPDKDELLGCLVMVQFEILRGPKAEDQPRVLPANAAAIRRLPGLNGQGG